MEHHFDIDLAQKYGLLEAILLNHFQFWIAKNEANELNYHDGAYWTFNSIKAIENLFPYASGRQIRYALDHLLESGLIQKGNYNKSAYDRTLWYAFTEKGKSILQNEQIHLTNLSNGSDRFVKPIPDNNTDNNTDDNTDNNVQSITGRKELVAEFEEIWKRYPKKQGKENALKAFLRARKDGVDKESIEKGLEAYLAFLRAEKVDPKYIKHGSTWFNQRCWEDDYSSGRKITTKDLASKMDFSDFMEG